MKKSNCLKYLFGLIILSSVCLITFIGCSSKKEKILIYTSSENYIVEDMSSRLDKEFPEYDIILEYIPTGNHAAKLLAEGKLTDCDISYNLEYSYLDLLDSKGLLAPLSYDTTLYCDDTLKSNTYVIQSRAGGAIIINTDVLNKKNLSIPTSYEDLLKPEYKGLISMSNPKSSSTGYMFLKSLVNAWGEEKTYKYFDELTPNILQYTSSGSGPVNALLQGEVAIGLGITSQAVIQINNKAPLKICYFEEGSPFSLYGQAIIAGKETRECVKEVFDFIVETYNYEHNEKFYPEQIYKDKVFTTENYPQDIVYSDMKNNTIDEKNRLLDKWKY